VDPHATIGTICNGHATIAVAAYDAHSGQREPGRFSSAGPTRDGRESRPTLAAPGCEVLSARSRPKDLSDALLQSRMSGTSMAAPHVAGTIALMFAAAPRPLWIEETRAILVGSVNPVSEEQRRRLGAGYLDPAAAVAAAGKVPRRAVRPTRPAPPLVPRPQLRLPFSQESEMARFQEPEWPEEPPFECEADYDEEVEAGGGEGLDHIDADEIVAVSTEDAEEQEHEGDEMNESSFDEDSAERSFARHRRGRSPGLPFQFQIPVGGAGGLGLGIPIGGRSSPFALSVPLTSPAPPPQPQPIPAPVAPPVPPPIAAPTAPPAAIGADEPPLTTALDLGLDPVVAATAHAVEVGEIDDTADEICGCEYDHESDPEDEAAMAEALRIDELERSYHSPDYSEIDEAYAGEQMMAAVGTMLDTAPGSSTSLMTALGEALDHVEGFGERGDASQVSLYRLFRAIADRSGPVPHLFGREVRVLARPGEPLGGVRPLRGDLLLRVLPGHRWVQLSFVAEPGLVSAQRLVERGLQPEGGVDMLPGRYVQVVEAWPVRRDEQDRYCRRLANAADLVLLDTMLLRLLRPGAAGPAEGEATEAESGLSTQPVLGPGAAGAAVKDLQHRLNTLHARRTAAGQPGLGDMPLAEDGRYGPRMRAAVQALQRLAPPGLVPRPDGVIGPCELERAGAARGRRGDAARKPPCPDTVSCPWRGSHRRRAKDHPTGAAAGKSSRHPARPDPALERHAGRP
jgi:hypothetical protein